VWQSDVLLVFGAFAFALASSEVAVTPQYQDSTTRHAIGLAAPAAARDLPRERFCPMTRNGHLARGQNAVRRIQKKLFWGGHAARAQACLIPMGVWRDPSWMQPSTEETGAVRTRSLGNT
jgi:hypothetical protein